MQEVKHYKVKSLPSTPSPNSVYYVKATTQGEVKTYITDQFGQPFPLIDLSLNGISIVNTLTGTGVTGTSSNPIVNISTFRSSQLGNLIELSSIDGKLFVKPIISPDNSIDIVSTSSALELHLGLTLQTLIQNALQPGDNISELVNDVGYITAAEVPPAALAATAWTTNHIAATGNPYLTGTLVYYSGHIFRANFNNDSISPTIGGNLYWTDLGIGNLIDQEQTDWDATSGTTFLKNKPTSTSSFINNGNGISNYVTFADLAPLTVGVLPPGGTAGQILTKIDATNYNATWQDNYADWTSVVKHTVRNDGTALITKGTPVYSTGSNGTNILVRAASNTSEATSSKTMGLMQSDITTTGGTQIGFVVTEGLLGELNTAGQIAGDPVWLGPNGTLIYGLTNKPYAPAHLVFIGIVTKVSAGNGEIFVKVQNGFELEELHNVDLKTTTPTNGEVLGFDGSLWKNKTIASLLGYTPFQLPALTNGSILFSNGTTIAQDNANFFIDNINKRVGFGTNAPVTTLHVVGGDLHVGNALGTTGLRWSQTSNTLSITGNTVIGKIGADLYYGSNNDTLQLRTAETTRVHITTTGDIGIGTITPSTTSKVNVNLGTFSGTKDGILIDGNCTSNPGFTGVRFSLLNSTANASGFVRVVRATGSSYLGMQITSQSRDGISFSTHATTPVERMRLDANGNLGIGTLVPTARLHIQAPGALSTDIALRVRNSADTGDLLFVDGLGNINFRNTDNGSFIKNNLGTYIELYNTGTGNMNFNGSASISNFVFRNQENERMRLTPLGSLLIGTTTDIPSSKLTIASTTQGFLPPRMTNAQRIAIATPAVGLMVYCTDATEGLYVNKSTGWTFII